MSSFQSRAPHCIESLCPFSCLWSVTVSQSSLVFHDLDWRSWGVLARYPIEYLPTWVCLVFFSYLNWDDGVWEGLPWKWSTPPPFSNIISRGSRYQHDSSLLTLTFVTESRWCLLGCSLLKVLFSRFISCSLKASTKSSPPWRELTSTS